MQGGALRGLRAAATGPRTLQRRTVPPSAAAAAGPPPPPPPPPRPLGAAQRRRAAAAAAGKRGGSSVSSGLIAVLKDELKVEKERYRTPEEVMAGPPNGFELDDTPHSNSITLARSFRGEDIYVEVDLDEQVAAEDDQEEYEEDEDEGFVPTPVVFTVTVSKGDSLLGFKCVGGGDYVRVTHVELDDAGEAANFAPYTGPVFDELDETLQQAFVDYLDERGVTPEFGSYLVELVADKLEVEYMNWLGRVRSFLEKGADK
ncbi:hypothetical protein Rsub_07317 [Raphidocelis subcapitata]|uniref:Mitochondrial glycoprotein n=1 Tax=Raphidocelis subcapitata TaxID=307507 RepID=A0A2V0P385_9CHLO|nr:hypothetical protein Rsub_07317 [Raphidocelis subcapitata]|eukprot:GBF94049.1 hypothetical protein Rsub_07317 [Raphidocelis subcapitata]